MIGLKPHRIGKSMARTGIASLGALSCALMLPAPAAAQQTEQDTKLVTCNKIDETVYFTLAHPVKMVKPEAGLNGIQYRAEGWWKLEPGKCRTINMSKLFKRNGVANDYKGWEHRHTYIYGETEGFFGIVKKAWEAEKQITYRSSNVFCIRMPKDRPFFTLRGYSDRGTRLSDACSASTYDKVAMNLLKFNYFTDNTARFDFTGE